MARALVALALLGGALFAVACVPTDEALPTGSAEFTIYAKDDELYVPAEDTDISFRRRWNVRFDRIRMSFKTVTIGQVGVPEQCSYRGRGARSNVIFDLSRGIVQTFNGLGAGDCPDVGVVLGLPDLATTLGAGMTVDDIAAMLAPPASHVIVEGRAIPANPDDVSTQPYSFVFRFDTERSVTTFGGCRSQVFRRGVRIVPEQRQNERITFNPFPLLFLKNGSRATFEHLAAADEDGNRDGIVTMDELDQMTLDRCRDVLGEPRGSRNVCTLRENVATGTVGDLVRDHLRDVIRYNDVGPCNGNPPGVE